MSCKENETAKVKENEELRKELSGYFENITGAPLCDAIDRSIREFTQNDPAYQSLEEEESRLEIEWEKMLDTMEADQADLTRSYVDALVKRGFKRTDLAYMAGVKDAIMMLRYLDVIKDR